MAVPPAPVPRPIGRPRRFDPEDERSQILEAALVVMRRTGYAEANLTEILAECGLSTGSFYRHFASKDDLLLHLFHQDAERAAERLSLRVERSGSSVDGVREWIDEVLSFGYDVRKRERVAVMGSQAARRAAGYDEAQRAARDLTVLPLVGLLERGSREGVLTSADPYDDARMIYAMAFAVVAWKVAGECRLSRAEALTYVLRFCGPAFGIGSAGEGGP